MIKEEPNGEKLRELELEKAFKNKSIHIMDSKTGWTTKTTLKEFVAIIAPEMFKHFQENLKELIREENEKRT